MNFTIYFYLNPNNDLHYYENFPKKLDQIWEFLFDIFKISRVVTSVKLIIFHPWMLIEVICTFICHFICILHHNTYIVHSKYWILSWGENLQMCYWWPITLVAAHFITYLPTFNNFCLPCWIYLCRCWIFCIYETSKLFFFSSCFF